MADRTERLFAALAPLNALVLAVPLLFGALELGWEAAYWVASEPADAAGLDAPRAERVAPHVRAAGEGDREPATPIPAVLEPSEPEPARTGSVWAGARGYGL